MGWSIQLIDAEGQPARVVRHREGGIVRLTDDNDRAEIDVTYNYREFFNFGRLHGLIAKASIPQLEEAVQRLGTDRSGNYWEPTPGNAGWIAFVLLQWARAYPEYRWVVS